MIPFEEDDELANLALQSASDGERKALKTSLRVLIALVGVASRKWQAERDERDGVPPLSRPGSAAGPAVTKYNGSAPTLSQSLASMQFTG